MSGAASAGTTCASAAAGLRLCRLGGCFSAGGPQITRRRLVVVVPVRLSNSRRRQLSLLAPMRTAPGRRRFRQSERPDRLELAARPSRSTGAASLAVSRIAPAGVRFAGPELIDQRGIGARRRARSTHRRSRAADATDRPRDAPRSTPASSKRRHALTCRRDKQRHTERFHGADAPSVAARIGTLANADCSLR